MDFSAPFEALEPGAAFTTRGRTVTAADLAGFPEIAHGPLVIGLACGLVPFDPARVSGMERVSEACFKRAVRAGDTVRVRGRIADLGSAGTDTGLVRFVWTLLNQDERTVCRAHVDVLWRREESLPAAADESDFVAIPL